jgi:DNA-binding NarL/FixJ family response regulator
MMNALGSAFALAKDPEAIQRAESLVRDYMFFLDSALQVLDPGGRAVSQGSRGFESLSLSPSGQSYSDGRVRKGLSTRELEIVRLVASGQTVGHIAHSFNISAHTVRNHLKACYRKVGVHTQIEMVNYAFAQGLVATP